MSNEPYKNEEKNLGNIRDDNCLVKCHLKCDGFYAMSTIQLCILKETAEQKLIAVVCEHSKNTAIIGHMKNNKFMMKSWAASKCPFAS